MPAIRAFGFNRPRRALITSPSTGTTVTAATEIVAVRVISEGVLGVGVNGTDFVDWFDGITFGDIPEYLQDGNAFTLYASVDDLPTYCQSISLTSTLVSFTITATPTAGTADTNEFAPYNHSTFAASGGTAPYTWAVVGNTDYDFSGNQLRQQVFGAAGVTNLTIKATDANTVWDTDSYQVTVSAPTLSLVTGTGDTVFGATGLSAGDRVNIVADADIRVRWGADATSTGQYIFGDGQTATEILVPDPPVDLHVYPIETAATDLQIEDENGGTWAEVTEPAEPAAPGGGYTLAKSWSDFTDWVVFNSAVINSVTPPIEITGNATNSYVMANTSATFYTKSAGAYDFLVQCVAVRLDDGTAVTVRAGVGYNSGVGPATEVAIASGASGSLIEAPDTTTDNSSHTQVKPFFYPNRLGVSGQQGVKVYHIKLWERAR